MRPTRAAFDDEPWPRGRSCPVSSEFSRRDVDASVPEGEHDQRGNRLDPGKRPLTNRLSGPRVEGEHSREAPLIVTPSALHFPHALVGQPADLRSVRIANRSAEPVDVEDIAEVPPAVPSQFPAYGSSS